MTSASRIHRRKAYCGPELFGCFSPHRSRIYPIAIGLRKQHGHMPESFRFRQKLMDQTLFSGGPFSGRSFRRRHAGMPCRLVGPALDVFATTKDLSKDGIAVLLPKGIRLKMKESAFISLPGEIILVVTPRYCRIRSRSGKEDTIVGFKVDAIERGEDQWKSLTGIGCK